MRTISDGTFALAQLTHKGLPKLLSANARLFRIVRATAWPILDAGTRWWLAQVFFVSGVLKVTHWQTALNLAANEYPVNWMDPVSAAYTGAAIELLGSILFAFGFLTRYAALSMLILTLVIQFNYQPFDNQLFWAVFFAWYAIHGAGPISVDNLLRKGLGDSALPVVPRLIAASRWIRLNLSELQIALTRIWTACALLRVAAPASAVWLPLSTSSHISSAAARVGGMLLLSGFATRYTAILLALMAVAGDMMDPRLTDDIYWLMLLGLLAVRGAGGLSIDALIDRWLRSHYPQLAGKPWFTLEGLPRVVIVGAGFGGLNCAAALRHERVSVTLVDRGNYHLFQPLLYQVATAAITPSDIATPIRSLFRDSFNIRVLLGTVTGVDARRKVVMMGTRELAYDYLVLATGAAHSYFGQERWAPFAPGLKRIEDATEIRRRLLTAFELAEATDDPAEREALLTFLIVGGGPTGVELAGAIAELARFGMEKDFRRFDPVSARVLLVQSAAKILPTFSAALSGVAQRSLEKLGVQVLIGSRVEAIDEEGVTVSGQRIRARTVLWAAGVMASPAAMWLKCASDSAGRIKVNADLSVPDVPSVYAIGDTALSDGWRGRPVPGLAPAAKQGGAYVARSILARIEGTVDSAPFAYKHRGSLATIGRKSAIADFGVVRIWGAPAWWLWGIVHIGFLVGLRNRVSTMVNWFWAYLTYGRGMRLITDLPLGVERPRK